MKTLAVKPQVCVIDDKLAVFMGSDYKLLAQPAAKVFMRAVHRNYELLARAEKRKKRAGR